MVKSIKKSYKYFIIVLAVIILLPTVLYVFIRIPEVQTFLTRRITGYLSKELKSTISVSKVNLTFINKLVLNDVLIKDQYDDTLVYIPKVTAGIKQIKLEKGIIKLGRVTLLKPVVAFTTDTAGQMNISWYLDMLKKPENTSGPKKSLFSINQVDISDARFSLRNKTGIKSKGLMDFNDLKIAGLNAILENLKVENDSTSFELYNLGFRESGGFVVKKMNCNMTFKNQDLIFRNLIVNCDSSIVKADHIVIMTDSSGSFRNFAKNVRLDIALEKSLFSSSDLKFFIPFLQNVNESVLLSGKISGTLSELKGRKIILSYKNNTHLDCNFDFSGLPDVENTFIYIDVNSLSTNSDDIEQINIPGKGYIKLPDVAHNLGKVTFSGSFTGFTTDFVTYGSVNTKKGVLSADISLRPDKSGRFRIKGLMKGTEIELGSFTNNPELFGNLNIEGNVDGYASSLKKFEVNMASKIESIDINGYKYSNILLNGFFTEKAWDGSIKIDDENIQMDFLGMLDFSNKLPEFDFNMNLLKANLYNLNIDRIDSTSSLSMLLTAKFTGNSIDNLDGEIKLINSNFKKHDNTLELNDFTIKTFIEDNLPVVSLKNDFFDARIKGYYNFSGLSTTLKYTLKSLMPSLFKFPDQPFRTKNNNFTFNVKTWNTDKLNEFFQTGILIADSSTITGSFYPDSLINITARTKLLSIKKNVFRDLSFNANVVDSVLKSSLKTSAFSLSGLSDLNDFNVIINTKPDTFNFLVDWDNKEKILNKGKLIATGTFSNNTDIKGKTSLKIELDSSDIYIRNNLWKIRPSDILVDSASISIGKLFIKNNENYYLVDGSLSKDPRDTLRLEFKGIDLDILNYLYNKSNTDPNKIQLDLKGNLNGKVLLTNVYRNFLFESDLKIENFSLLGINYGQISVESVWNNSQKIADIRASNNFAGIKMFDIKGYYDPESRQVSLNATAMRLPIDILNPLLKVFASGIAGYATGSVNFSGEFSKPYLTGSLKVDNGSIKIDYLQTKYTFNDSVRFDRSGIKFNNVRVSDEKGNIATVNGTVFHKYFKVFTADLVIRTNGCMVLNTREKDNDMFYGTAFASGVTTIKSDGSSVTFNISAKTGKNTRLNIPINYGLSVSDFSYINFHDPNQDLKANPVTDKISVSPQQQSRMELNFDLEVTPEAEVQLIMDSKAGDVIKGHGTGNLNLSLNKKGEFKMSGDYIIEDGDYLFTLRNIFNKRFSVENGGKISFNGDVMDAEIDLNAIYKLKASLSDIMPPGTVIGGSLNEAKIRERIPVECHLNLTGKLFKPVVVFDITLPTADEGTRAYLKSMINSDEDMSRQFAFLLVMNRFYPNPSIVTQTGPTVTGYSAVGVTTFEMLSNQLSNWASQISNNLDIGVGYRPSSSTQSNSQDFQFALSTQVLNDKVIINGNFDYGGNQSGIPGSSGSSASNSITGAFDVEFKITEKIRFKVFNRSNDNFYFDNGIQYTQGVGLFFRQDFNKLKDLFKKPVKGDMKKEKETKVK
jgi:hypothetical protein